MKGVLRFWLGEYEVQAAGGNRAVIEPGGVVFPGNHTWDDDTEQAITVPDDGEWYTVLLALKPVEPKGWHVHPAVLPGLAWDNDRDKVPLALARVQDGQLEIEDRRSWALWGC